MNPLTRTAFIATIRIIMSRLGATPTDPNRLSLPAQAAGDGACPR